MKCSFDRKKLAPGYYRCQRFKVDVLKRFARQNRGFDAQCTFCVLAVPSRPLLSTPTPYPLPKTPQVDIVVLYDAPFEKKDDRRPAEDSLLNFGRDKYGD